MQTFLPYGYDFEKSLACLDNKRAGKQRVEAFQIIGSIKNGGAWKNHVAVRMWANNIEALRLYYNFSLAEWEKRGFKNSMKTMEIGELEIPSWLSDPRLAFSHRSNLLRKDYSYYSKFGWGIDKETAEKVPYWWPVQKKTKDLWNSDWDNLAKIYWKEILIFEKVEAV